MELQQLKIFKACADAGSITKAAENLYMDQSKVSRSIKNLEEELDITLFIRSKKGLMLTSEGETFYKKNAEILSQLNHLRHMGGKRHYDVFSVYTFHSSYISYAFAQLCNHHKGDDVEMRLLDMENEDMFDCLEYSPSDIGFIYRSEKQGRLLDHVLEKHGLQFTPLCNAVPAVFLGLQSPFAHEQVLRKEQIEEINFFRTSSNYWKQYSDLRKTIQYYNLEKSLEHSCIVSSGYGIIQMLRNSSFSYLGHVWTDENHMNQKTIIGPNWMTTYDNYALLDSADGNIEMGYISHRNGCWSNYARELISLIKELFLDTPLEYQSNRE